MTVTMYFDGAIGKNPGGQMAWAWLLETDGVPFDSDYGVDPEPGPDNTNNVAEYRALIEGLQAAIEGQVSCLQVRGDSRLVIKQMRGEWRCKSERLRPFYNQGLNLQQDFEQITFKWIPREQNEQADELALLAYAEQ